MTQTEREDILLLALLHGPAAAEGDVIPLMDELQRQDLVILQLPAQTYRLSPAGLARCQRWLAVETAKRAELVA